MNNETGVWLETAPEGRAAVFQIYDRLNLLEAPRLQTVCLGGRIDPHWPFDSLAHAAEEDEQGVRQSAGWPRPSRQSAQMNEDRYRAAEIAREWLRSGFTTCRWLQSVWPDQ